MSPRGHQRLRGREPLLQLEDPLRERRPRRPRRRHRAGHRQLRRLDLIDHGSETHEGRVELRREPLPAEHLGDSLVADRDDRAGVVRCDGVGAELEQTARGIGIVGDPHTQERAAGVDSVAETVACLKDLQHEREHPRVALACRLLERVLGVDVEHGEQTRWGRPDEGRGCARSTSG